MGISLEKVQQRQGQRKTWVFVNRPNPSPVLWWNLRRLFIPASYRTQPSIHIKIEALHFIKGNMILGMKKNDWLANLWSECWVVSDPVIASTLNVSRSHVLSNWKKDLLQLKQLSWKHLQCFFTVGEYDLMILLKVITFHGTWLVCICTLSQVMYIAGYR